MKNKYLKPFYDSVYKKGERGHYTKLRLAGRKLAADRAAVLEERTWRGKTVLDVGCGTGETVYHIARRGARRVVGLDYSAQAIAVARETYRHRNLFFEKKDVRDVREKFDVIFTMGTLEHMDHPLPLLKKLKALLNPGGSLIVTSPNWSNPRGYVLLTLFFLFKARITLADLHHFTPVEFIGWAKKLGMKLQWRTVDQEWSHGEKLVRDFARRLPNVARDSKLPTTQKEINAFIRWITTHIIPLERDAPHTGAIGVYHFRK
ncbi:MAG: methyltransferase domain-containing protein [Patescibacteria group bacterium]